MIVLTSAYVLIVVYVHAYKIMYIGIARIRTNGYALKYIVSFFVIEKSLANGRDYDSDNIIASNYKLVS